MLEIPTNVMEIVGYIASIFIGISLGLIGGGGSILTVPVLVYFFGIHAVLATTYSLFIVGSTSLVGMFTYLKKGLVSVKTAFFFGVPSIIAVYCTRTFLLPAIPENIGEIGGYTLHKDTLLMLLFAILMVLASYSMIRKRTTVDSEELALPFNYTWVFIQGIIVGLVTGLVGAGGGFLIIPALVNLLKLPMKTAVGTSLLIIAVNSLGGFLFSIARTEVNWSLLTAIASIAVAGIIIGSYLSTKISGGKLKPAFGWFVLLMGIYILIKETVLK